MNTRRLSLFYRLLFFLPFIVTKAIAAEEKGIDVAINNFFAPISKYSNEIVFFKIPFTEIPFVLALLVLSALFFTLKFGFINIRGLGLALRTVKGRYSKKDDPGEITHFQALSAALSATVGLGNIAGVAIAISIGGPGATFWMVLCGVFGMTTKFCECTLGTKYRLIDSKGKVSGGPMYYLSRGFDDLGMARFGKFLAIIFSIACVLASFGGGNMFQGNQAYEQLVNITGGSESFFDGKGWLFGIILAVTVGSVILGGIVGIAKVTARLVPFMCIVYVACACYILLTHVSEIPLAVRTIIDGAFNIDAGMGALLGVLIQGVKRAAFSNEAGFGSAPIAHAAVKTTKPASEGYVALLEPFVDTVVVCTMTALVIVITGKYVPDAANADWGQAIGVTSLAFGSVISWFPYILFMAVLLFAFSTMISWSYYGQQAWAYLFGKSKRMEITYKLIFCAMVVLGASVKMGHVMNFSDAALFAMCFPNFIGLYFLLPKVTEELKSFKKHVAEVEAQK